MDFVVRLTAKYIVEKQLTVDIEGNRITFYNKERTYDGYVGDDGRLYIMHNRIR